MSIKNYIEDHCPLLYAEIEKRIEAGTFNVYANVTEQLRGLYADLMDAPPCPAHTITKNLLQVEQALQER
jgi:hypothetical protein